RLPNGFHIQFRQSNPACKSRRALTHHPGANAVRVQCRPQEPVTSSPRLTSVRPCRLIQRTSGSETGTSLRQEPKKTQHFSRNTADEAAFRTAHPRKWDK